MTTAVAQPSPPGKLSGSLLKGFAILELLANEDRPLGVSEIARHMGTAKSGVHHVLQVMREAGWIRQTEHGHYECSLKLWELGQRLTDRIDLLRLAAPAMRQLAAETQETVHLSILDNGDVLYLEKFESTQPIRASTRIGGRSPAYCVATGKTLLAYASDDVVTSAIRNMEKFTALTATSRDDLERDFSEIRRTGYSINLGEWLSGVRGVASAVLDRHGRAVAAIGIAGPADRLTESVLHDFAPLVLAASKNIAHAIGHAGAEDLGLKRKEQLWPA